MQSNFKYLGIILMGLALMAPGCLNLGNWSLFGGTDNYPSAGTDPFLLDNDGIFDLFEDGVSVEPKQVKIKHTVGKTDCPQKLEPVKISGPEGSTFKIINLDTAPDWVSLDNTSGPLPAVINPEFNCMIPEFKDQEGRIDIRFISPDSGSQFDSFFDVFMDIEVQ